MSERFKTPSAVYLILRKNSEILLVKRANSGHMDGYYSLPAGHVDENESALEAAIREAKEEIGIDLKKESLRHAITMHNNFLDKIYMNLFFEVLSYDGEISNKEPHKCEEIQFFAPSSLPGQMVPYVKQAIMAFGNGLSYYEFGW